MGVGGECSVLLWKEVSKGGSDSERRAWWASGRNLEIRGYDFRATEVWGLKMRKWGFKQDRGMTGFASGGDP